MAVSDQAESAVPKELLDRPNVVAVLEQVVAKECLGVWQANTAGRLQ
jgi:hypothetical protein